MFWIEERKHIPVQERPERVVGAVNSQRSSLSGKAGD
jgi:hypothetical protein